MYKNILDMVGNTRMLDLSQLGNNPNVKIYAKTEGDNPGGSIKDRPVKAMILDAIKSGNLTKDKTIIEATSGNTGIAVALIGAALGYKVVLVMSDAVSVERQKLIQAYGAKIVFTPGEFGTDGAIRKAREMVSQNPDMYYYPDQFSNPNNPLSHRATANEIWKQTKGKITHFVCAVGTGGTIMGVGKRLKQLNPNIKIIEAQPFPKHKIQGLKNMTEAIVPQIYSATGADERIYIKDEDAFAMSRKLANIGLLVGMSSGAAMHVALEAIKNKSIVDPKTESVIVTILPDGGMKYLSTTLYEQDKATTYDNNYEQCPNLYDRHELKSFSRGYLCSSEDEIAGSGN
ncbi:MAG: cysteine synthase family protein [Firmicutes bacterium]|nr:cysteine synthase family protein [Bacillota bacterium]